ncbi:MAG: D-alanyl-D-alanine carboxypeptidase family protein [Frankiaceae bacterium]|nr:D-alanyl-D-alanine carboxypeptidase family protein [Frankiaceae bacterium]
MRPHRRARVGATAAALAVLLSGVVVPAAAGADDVGSAKAQVAAMQARVEAVAATLAKGSREYEAGQRHLTVVQRKQRAIEREAAELRRATVVEQRRLNAIASAAYRRPLPSSLSLAFTANRESFTAALSAQADLEHVSGSQQDVLREVVARRVRLEHLTRTAQQLTADAQRTERALSRQLSRLRDIADRANAELQAAAARLDKAQAAERARLERLRALRASRARALRSGPMCLGESTDGYANGFVPDSALCPLWGAPGHKLRSDAAASFNQMSRFHAETAGGPLCVTDSYRTYGEQVSVYRRKPGLAATPGTSEHGWGKAVDFCGGVERYGSHAFQWMKDNAGRFGFFHPAWAEPSGSRPEAWHWEYSG